MDDYGEDNQKMWVKIFKDVVAPILLNSDLGITKFSCVEGSEYDIKYNIDYFMEMNNQVVPVAVRGRTHSKKDLTLRQVEYLKLTNNVLKMQYGRKVKYFPILYIYYSVDDETLTICKTISIYYTTDVIETANNLEEEDKLKWRKIGKENPFAPVNMYELNKISKKNGHDFYKFEDNGFVFICTKHLKDKEIMVKDECLKSNLFL